MMFQDTSLIVEINQASYGGSSKKAKCSTWTFEPTHNPSFITWRVAYLLKVCEIIVISIKRWCSKEWYTTTLAMKLKKLRKNKNWLQIYDIKHHKEGYCPLENTKCSDWWYLWVYSTVPWGVGQWLHMWVFFFS